LERDDESIARSIASAAPVRPDVHAPPPPDSRPEHASRSGCKQRGRCIASVRLLSAARGGPFRAWHLWFVFGNRICGLL